MLVSEWAGWGSAQRLEACRRPLQRAPALPAGYLRLWSGGPDSDPWSTATDSSQHLTELRTHWNANMQARLLRWPWGAILSGGSPQQRVVGEPKRPAWPALPACLQAIPRTTVHMLSGQPTGGGIAYIGVLCDWYRSRSSGAGYGEAPRRRAASRPTSSSAFLLRMRPACGLRPLRQLCAAVPCRRHWIHQWWVLLERSAGALRPLTCLSWRRPSQAATTPTGSRSLPAALHVQTSNPARVTWDVTGVLHEIGALRAVVLGGGAHGQAPARRRSTVPAHLPPVSLLSLSCFRVITSTRRTAMTTATLEG